VLVPCRPLLHRAPIVGLFLLAVLLLGPLGVAQADDGSAHEDSPDAPVRMILATSGLSWDDVDARTTPHLECLARTSGLGAMNTTSTTVVSMKEQGMETLHTGYRGLAADAPRTAGIPNPPTDHLADLPHGSATVDARSDVGADVTHAVHEVATGEDPSLLVVDLGAVDDPDTDPAALDERVGEVLEAAGTDADTCTDAGSSLPRTLVLSVAATDPPDPQAEDSERSVASRSAGLQVAMDTAFPGQALVSGSTHQNGLVVLTDVLPTVLDSYGQAASSTLPGQPFSGDDVHGASGTSRQLVQDRSDAARLVDDATLPALGSWLALGVVGLVLLLVRPWARRPRVHGLARALLTVTPLAMPVGLVASAVPWWRASHPTLALIGFVWAGCLVLSAVVLAGPWRRWSHGPTGMSAALVAGLILLECALGSPFQTGSPLGAQPISGGRFYGLSNHLFGMVLAGTMVALACLFTILRRPRSRVLWTIGVGLAVAGVCVAPQMGADFGSMLVSVPTFGLLALLVSGIRTRVWHVLALLAGGVVAVLGVSSLDWLRPPAERSHLGRFIDELLSGNLITVVVRKLAQNVHMVMDFPALGLVMLLALAASIAVIVPARLHWRALAALEDRHPTIRRTMIMLVAGMWLGYAVNDTGPVLVAATLGLAIPWVAAMIAGTVGEREGARTR
jgi:hypothetical protein